MTTTPLTTARKSMFQEKTTRYTPTTVSAVLPKWRLRKHRGVSKWHLANYVKSFQFIHNHRHFDISGKFVMALAAILDLYPGRQA